MYDGVDCSAGESWSGTFAVNETAPHARAMGDGEQLWHLRFLNGAPSALPGLWRPLEKWRGPAWPVQLPSGHCHARALRAFSDSPRQRTKESHGLDSADDIIASIPLVMPSERRNEVLSPVRLELYGLRSHDRLWMLHFVVGSENGTKAGKALTMTLSSRPGRIAGHTREASGLRPHASHSPRGCSPQGQ